MTLRLYPMRRTSGEAFDSQAVLATVRKTMGAGAVVAVEEQRLLGTTGCVTLVRLCPVERRWRS